MSPTVMLSHYLWCIPICQVFFNLFTVVCIIKTIGMLSVLFLFIHKPLSASPPQKKSWCHHIITTTHCQLHENPWLITRHYQF